MSSNTEQYSMVSSSQQFPRHFRSVNVDPYNTQYPPSFPAIQFRHCLLYVSQNGLGAYQYATQELLYQPQYIMNTRNPYLSISPSRNPGWSMLPSNGHPLPGNTPFDHDFPHSNHPPLRILPDRFLPFAARVCSIKLPQQGNYHYRPIALSGKSHANTVSQLFAP